jgi:hypothetical protein
MNMNDNGLFLRCTCHSLDHLIHVESADEPGSPDVVSMSVSLNHYKPWYRRLLAAVKYVFKIGSESGDSHYDCTILDVDQAKTLRDLLTTAIYVYEDRRIQECITCL